MKKILIVTTLGAALFLAGCATIPTQTPVITSVPTATVVPTTTVVPVPTLSPEEVLDSALDAAGVTYTPNSPVAPQTAYDYMQVICAAQHWTNPDGTIGGNAAWQQLEAIDREDMKLHGDALDPSQTYVSKIGVPLLCPGQ